MDDLASKPVWKRADQIHELVEKTETAINMLVDKIEGSGIKGFSPEHRITRRLGVDAWTLRELARRLEELSKLLME